MEQIQNELRKAGLAKRGLARHRAMELGMKHPQLMEFDNQPEPTEPPMRGSGGDAGLARLVGRGKSKKSCGGTNGVMRGGFLGALASLALPLIGKLFGNGKMTKDAHDELSTRLNGGMFGIPPLISMIGKLFGNGKMTKDAHDAIVAVLRKKKGKKNSASEVEMSDSDSESDSGKMSGGARHQGKMLGDHLVKLHGEGFFDDFAKGFMSVIKPFAGVASMLPGTIGTVGRVASGLMGNGKLEMELTHEMPKRGRGRPRKMCGGNAPHASTANAVGHARMSSVYNSLPGAGLGGADACCRYVFALHQRDPVDRTVLAHPHLLGGHLHRAGAGPVGDPPGQCAGAPGCDAEPLLLLSHHCGRIHAAAGATHA